MAAQIQGMGFKSLLSQLVADPIVGAEMRRRVEQMADEGWYPWEEYVELLRRLEERLSSRALLALAYNAVATRKDALRAFGLDSPKAIFGNYAALVGQFSRDLGPDLEPRTVRFEPGLAIVEEPAVLPHALVEGYLRGWAVVAGVELEKVVVTPFERSGKQFLTLELRWPVAVSVPSRSSDSQLR